MVHSKTLEVGNQMTLRITGSEKLVLVIGSAPSSETWIQKYRARLGDFDEIATINNSWQLLPGIQKVWYVASDFYSGPKLGVHQPTAEDMKLIEKRDHINHYHQPYGYQEKFGSCMFLNVMYQSINRHFLHPTGVIICTVGCDADYTQPKTHFYGTGNMTEATAKAILTNVPQYEGKAVDPLRWGHPWFVQRCRKVMFACPTVKLLNISEHARSLLPFSRITCEELLKSRINR